MEEPVPQNIPPILPPEPPKQFDRKVIIIVVSILVIVFVSIGFYFIKRIGISNQTAVSPTATTKSEVTPGIATISEEQNGDVTYPKTLSVEEKNALLNLIPPSSNQKTHILLSSEDNTNSPDMCYNNVGTITGFYLISKEQFELNLTNSKGQVMAERESGIWGATYEEHYDQLVQGGEKFYVVLIEIPFGGSETYSLKVSPKNKTISSGKLYTLVTAWVTEDDTLTDTSSSSKSETSYSVPVETQTLTLLAQNKQWGTGDGFSIQTPKKCDVSNQCGLKAISFIANSPAQQGGLKIGNLITGINGVPFTKKTISAGMPPLTADKPTVFNTNNGDITVIPKYFDTAKKALSGVAYETLVEGCK